MPGSNELFLGTVCSRTMPKNTELAPANILLRTLSDEQRRRLDGRSERRDYAVGTVVVASETVIQHVYFPETGLVSLLCVLPDRSAVETAVVGPEGMAPIAIFHGVDRTPEQVVVQVSGTMLRVEVGVFLELVRETPLLRAALHRFSQALYTFAAQSSACNRMHSVSQRCARWLLATHDRISTDEFPLTHLFLSQMVGVRRSSVTLAAEELRDAGAISYGRGKIRIVNRGTLRKRSCDCYKIVRFTYDRIVQGLPGLNPLTEPDVVDGEFIVHAGDPEGAHPSRRRQTIEEASHEVLAELGRQRRDGGNALPASDGAKRAASRTGLHTVAAAIDDALDRLRDAQVALKSLS